MQSMEFCQSARVSHTLCCACAGGCAHLADLDTRMLNLLLIGLTQGQGAPLMPAAPAAAASADRAGSDGGAAARV